MIKKIIEVYQKDLIRLSKEIAAIQNKLNSIAKEGMEQLTKEQIAKAENIARESNGDFNKVKEYIEECLQSE